MSTTMLLLLLLLLQSFDSNCFYSFRRFVIWLIRRTFSDKMMLKIFAYNCRFIFQWFFFCKNYAVKEWYWAVSTKISFGSPWKSLKSPWILLHNYGGNPVLAFLLSSQYCLGSHVQVKKLRLEEYLSALRICGKVHVVAWETVETPRPSQSLDGPTLSSDVLPTEDHVHRINTVIKVLQRCWPNSLLSLVIRFLSPPRWT